VAVTHQQALTTGSWALPANHEMYSGAHGFFETILADDRFVRQRTAADEPTSWFRLTSSRWQVVGLDTTWHDPLIEFVKGNFTGLGATGHLQDPQASTLAGWADDTSRRLLLLSHHQLFTT
jgi:hypothetical protein